MASKENIKPEDCCSENTIQEVIKASKKRRKNPEQTLRDDIAKHGKPGLTPKEIKTV